LRFAGKCGEEKRRKDYQNGPPFCRARIQIEKLKEKAAECHLFLHIAV